MITHLVLFKYRDDAAPGERDGHLSALRGLVGVVPEAATLRVGADVLRTARSYDTGLSLTVADRAALARYADHPAHRDAAALGVRLCASIVAVDFEGDEGEGLS